MGWLLLPLLSSAPAKLHLQVALVPSLFVGPGAGYFVKFALLQDVVRAGVDDSNLVGVGSVQPEALWLLRLLGGVSLVSVSSVLVLTAACFCLRSSSSLVGTSIMSLSNLVHKGSVRAFLAWVLVLSGLVGRSEAGRGGSSCRPSQWPCCK